MSKKIKNLVLLGIFIIILSISTLTGLFSSKVLWQQPNNKGAELSGILFKSPNDVANLKVNRKIEKNDAGDLIRYDVEFEYTGGESSFRIIGTPVRQVFFDEGLVAKYSKVKLKGEYDGINKKLFDEKLSLRDSYKKIGEYKFSANSNIRVLINGEGTYAFSLYYQPREFFYKSDDLVSKVSVFVTNVIGAEGRNDKELSKENNFVFNDSGYYINAQEEKNTSVISKISIVNNLNTAVFLISCFAMIIIIWLDKKSLMKIFPIMIMLMVLTFHRFLGIGSTFTGSIVILPILAYVGMCITKLMEKDDNKLVKKELMQNLAFTIIFIFLVIIIKIIPNAI